jgi:hypothetical protein
MVEPDKLWEWPCVQHPDTVSPYPKGSYADKNWRPNLEAQARYIALEEALVPAQPPLSRTMVMTMNNLRSVMRDRVCG